MRNSKKIAAAALMLVLLAAVPSFGSGGHECDDMACNSFFMPNIIRHPNDEMFFLRGRTFTGGQYRALQNLDSINLKEWAAYFGEAVLEGELYSLVYKTSADELSALHASLSGKNETLPEAFKKVRDKTRVLRALRYLILAKRVEPIAMANANRTWDSPPRQVPDPALVRELITTAERQLRGSDKFITQRYRFQVMRLLYYGNQFGEAQKYFERHQSVFTEENSPKYRFIDLAAGAYFKDKKFGKANYLFSLVFDKFEPLRFASYRSFHPMEDADWRETLSLARNSHEREVLWQLLGIYADGMAAIEAIHKSNPKSELLPLLLVREINRTEGAWNANLYRMHYFGDGGDNGGRSDRESVGPERLVRLQKVADARKTSQPYLWLLATGHMFALAGDSTQAEKYILEAIKSMPEDDLVRSQARMSLLFARVRAIKAIDKTVEPMLAQELMWLWEYMGGTTNSSNYRARTMNFWIRDYLRDIYRAGSDPVRALLLSDNPRSADYRSAAGVEALLEFKRQARTEFDVFLSRTHESSVEELQELRAINYLFDGNFSAAVDSFKLAGGSVSARLARDPFISRINDCPPCDSTSSPLNVSKLTFAERMLALSRSAQGQGESAAQASFDLATGLYNMSFYGNSSEIYDTPRSNLSPRRGESPIPSPVIRMDLAEKYYVQAASLSANREFKARATFMASKAEQNTRYNADRNNGNNRTPGIHYRTLRDSYSDTQYYKEIIAECGYFKSYVER